MRQRVQCRNRGVVDDKECDPAIQIMHAYPFPSITRVSRRDVWLWWIAWPMSSLGERLKGANRGGIRHRLTPVTHFAILSPSPFKGHRYRSHTQMTWGAMHARHDTKPTIFRFVCSPRQASSIEYTTNAKLAAALLPETCGPWNRPAWHGNRFDRRGGYQRRCLSQRQR